MQTVTIDGATLHVRMREGDGGQRPIVFANSLGTDLRIWDDVVAALPPDIPILRYDKRGHGLSDDTPLTMDTHVADLAGIMDAVGVKGALVCGVSVGGMIAQGLAATRPDLVAGLVLSNTGMAIGDADTWNTRIEAVGSVGLEEMAGAILERWFTVEFRKADPGRTALYHNMVARTPAQGYAATCAAIRDTDLTDSTSRLTVPTLCIAGGADGSTPPDKLREIATAVQGATLHEIEDVAHLPNIEVPETVSKLITDHYGTLG